MSTLDMVLLLLAIGLCSGAFALALALQRRHNRQQAELIQRIRDRGPVRVVGIPSPISRMPSDRQARQSLHTQSSSPATHPPVGFALFDSSGPIAGSANDFAPTRGFDGGSSAGGGSSGSWDSSPHDSGSSSGSCGGGGGD